MGEISEACCSSSFDAETMRKSKVGLKRLFITLSLLFSFILGAPFLLKTIEIYRSPLPFSEIDRLSTSIESNPVSFPCSFQAVYVGFDHTYTSANSNEIGFSIESQMREFAPSSGVCGACSDNFSVSVTIDSASSCSGGLWKCGALDGLKLEKNAADLDNEVDEYLKAVLGTGEEKVYTVVVVNKDGEKGVRAVVGKYRHAWIVGNFGKEEAEKRIAEIFMKLFVNGGRDEWMIPGEFMPVGADGKVVLSFNLLNADPRDWIYDWDLQEIDQTLLAPIMKALKVVADVSVESQVVIVLIPGLKHLVCRSYIILQNLHCHIGMTNGRVKYSVSKIYLSLYVNFVINLSAYYYRLLIIRVSSHVP
ncbi:hypothetical protein Leryth_017828 [Lithospermum erythrorhizon]|nr:hypothetical protein Leryth_017828 [Lithospermum erythrorhizon]